MIDLKKLKGIIPQSELPKLQDYSILLKNPENPKRSYEIDEANKTLIFNVSAFPRKELRNLKDILLDAVEKNTCVILDKGKSALLDKLYSYDASADNQILDFFKDVLARRDWDALRDSLFLRSEFIKHNDIKVLKSDIRSRYGDRGNNISNLCTAGYFEQVMMPLFNADKTKFWEYWDLALDKGLTALFVNSQMKISDISWEINRRIELGRKYGLKYIHIHAIGSTNVSKLIKSIAKEKVELKFSDKYIFTEKLLNVVMIELIL